MAIAMTGLDQDMMQRNMSCRDSASSRNNMMVSSLLQLFIVSLFLFLGTLLLLYCEHNNINLPDKSDEIFGLVATHPDMPAIVGILFVLGLISAAYSAAGSALTSLTTSFTVDILDAPSRMNELQLTSVRRRVHMAMSAIMGIVIIIFYHISDSDAISAVYTLASYTYGPILGLFVFGLSCHRRVRDAAVPAICIASPILSWCIQWALATYLGYQTGFELLLINAAVTIIALLLSAINVNQKSESHVEKSV